MTRWPRSEPQTGLFNISGPTRGRSETPQPICHPRDLTMVHADWHDGKPFTAQDVKCTWDLLSGKTSEKLRINPRKSWYSNVEEVTTNGDYEVTFRLKRPQPALLALLASGWAPIYPCHVSPRDMRSRPIGTGPFKFVEFKPNEVIRVTKNRDYWKEGRPYLDGIEWTIIKDTATRNLADRADALRQSSASSTRQKSRAAVWTGLSTGEKVRGPAYNYI